MIVYSSRVVGARTVEISVLDESSVYDDGPESSIYESRGVE